MERAGQEMHTNIEKLKAAKEYLAQKLNDAQTRIGSTSVPVAESEEGALDAEAMPGSWAALEGLAGISGPLRPPAAAWSSQPLEEEAIENSNVPLHAPSRREGAVAITPPPQSPTLSAGNSLEDGAGSNLANSLVGSAVIMEDLETLESRRNQMRSLEATVSVAVDDAPIKSELEAASKLSDEVVQLGPSGRDVPCIDGNVSGATVISVTSALPDTSTPSDSRLVWTSAELAASRDEFNSAVHEATSLRLSEAAVSERSSEAVDRLRAVAGLTTEEVVSCAPSRSINDDQNEVLPADLQPQLATGVEGTELERKLLADVRRLTGAEQAARQRIVELEALTQELEGFRKAAHERIEILEARNLELEKKLQAQPRSLTSELEERLAATRMQSEEVMKECEHRQETLEAMESRLQQAERMVLQPPTVGGVVGSGAPILGNTPQRTNMLAANGSAGEGSSLDAARERVKLLYDQLMSRDVQVESADGTSAVQRLGAAAEAPIEKQSLANTLMSIAASISQPPQAPASNASGISTPTAALDASRRTQEPGVQMVAPQSSAQPAVLAMMTPSTRNLEVVPGPVTKAAVCNAVPSQGPLSPQRALSPQRTSNFLAASPPHVEVRRFKQNVDDLQSLVLQMVGDKTRTASGLERKVAELENLVEQVGKGNNFPLERHRSSSLETQPPYLVGSISSTATLSPSRLREVAPLSPSGSLNSPGPRGIRQARAPSPAPTTGSASTVRHLYRHSPQSTPGVTSVRQAATSPSPISRRAVTPSPLRAMMSGRTGSVVTTSRAPSRQPSLPTSRAATPLSRTASPAPLRSSSAASSHTTVAAPGGSYAWQIPSIFNGGALPGPIRMTGQVSTTIASSG